MAVTRIPLAVPNLGPQDEAAVSGAVRSGWVSSVGPDVQRFEAAIAAVSGTEQAVAVASGTAALVMALRALGVERNDLVLCPTFTFIATANAISACGADPVFIDSDPHTWALDLNKAEIVMGGLKRAGLPAPRAVVVVYPMGNPVDPEPYRAFAKRHGMAFVVDAAAAIGATFDGRPIGLLADATAISFNGNKTITTGGGGAVVGPAAVVAKARHLATTGRVGVNYDHDVPAYNERITNLEAALGCAQIARLDDFLKAKRAVRDIHDAFASRHGLATFPRDHRADRCDWLSGVVLPKDRDVAPVVAFLNQRGVDVRLFWKPLHLQQAYQPLVGRLAEAQVLAPFESSEGLWRRVLPLPCSTHITQAEIETVHAALAPALMEATT
jgi:dTDP-4-amino-4,6-dideoxygalactose transaminase